MQRAAVQLQDALHNTQPQAATTITLIDTAERFGNELPMGFIYARPLSPASPVSR
jgi:hypothetical protein